MLANNFMTPSALGISDAELDALVKVLGMLERGEIPEDQFTMRRVQHPCRTPACLCGWANHVSAGRAFPHVPSHPMMFGNADAYRPRWRGLPRKVLELFGVGGGPVGSGLRGHSIAGGDRASQLSHPWRTALDGSSGGIGWRDFHPE